MAGVTISYKGSQIASMTSSGTKTLTTSGQYCEDNITVGYSAPSLNSVAINEYYLPSQSTTIENGFIGTQLWYEYTSLLSNTKQFQYNVQKAVLKQGYFVSFKTNTSYNIIGEIILKWANNDTETYSINTTINLSRIGNWFTVPFTWSGIGRVQTFQEVKLVFSTSQCLGILLTSNDYINDTITLQETSYFSIYENINGYDSITLNLIDNPQYLNIYKSLAYRSMITSNAIGVSEWCNSLSIIDMHQFAGQPLSGSFTFNNVSKVSKFAFGSVYTNTQTGTVYNLYINCPSCTEIDNGAFANNKNIKEVYFSNCSLISDYAFSNCTVSTVSFPECISIKISAFENCIGLSSINFPKCTNIGQNAFYNCMYLRHAIFPECQSIEYGAFSNCRVLSDLSFPKCTNIGSAAFNSCITLTDISFPECTNISSFAFSNCTSLTNISFPKCTNIGSSAFNSCITLTTINFPSCTTIGSSAFAYCKSLTTISFPLCTSINSGAFWACYSLVTVSFPSCTTIRNSVFYTNSSLTTANFPLCTSIGQSAFTNCKFLTTISFPLCEFIGSYAFYNCYSLTTISFPSCTSIGQAAFYCCSKLESAYFMGSSIPSVGTTIFSNTPIHLSTYLGYFGSIYVPASLLASYKTATNWATYSNRMVGI